MSDDLRWRPGARHPGHDYGVFTTAFLDSTNPRTGAPKRFSLIECPDWVNIEEETGYGGGTATLIGRTAPNPALQNNTLHTVLVTGVSLVAPPRPDDGEVLAVHTAPLAEVHRQIRSGEIEHALVVVAFAHLALR